MKMQMGLSRESRVIFAHDLTVVIRRFQLPSHL